MNVRILTRKKILTIAVVFLVGTSLFFPGTTHSQDWYSSATYEVSVPAGDLQEFTDATSWLGFGLGFRKVLQRDLTGGLYFGWHVFHERTDRTLKLENGDLSGTQDRYANSFPIMLNVHHYFGNRGDIRPFVGLNAGGYILLQRFEIGIISLQKDSFEWGLIPEVGAVVPLSRDVTLLLQGKFSYAFTGKGIGGEDMKLAYWGITAGFAWQQY
jgi:hypothetical protein